MSEFPYPYDATASAAKIPPHPPMGLLMLRRLRFVLAAMAGCIALSNATLFPVSKTMRPGELSELWTAFSYGLIGAEAGLLAIAAVLGPGKGLLRHFIVIPWAILWILTWLLGYAFVWWRDPNGYLYPEWREVLAGILMIPVMFCACESPLWVFRTLFRWRIQLPDCERRAAPQLSIAGILIATGGVAIALTAVRVGRYIEGTASEAEWWGGCGIAVALAGGLSLATLPLCTWATLRCPSLPVGLIAMVAWLFTVAFILICIISVLDGGWPAADFWRPFTGIVGGFAFGLLGILSLVRIAGYRLFWGRGTTQVTSSASATRSGGPTAPQP